MTNLEQAAKEYAEKNFPFIWPLNKEGERIEQRVGQKNPPGSRKAKDKQEAHTKSFLAGAAHAEGAFAEWILTRFSSIEFIKGEYKWWDKTIGGRHFTTAELYQLWQQSLS